MLLIRDALKSISSYPIPFKTLQEVAERRGMQLDDEATTEVLQGNLFNLVIADLLLWLSFAPQVTQGGQSYSFTDEQRLQMRNRANDLFAMYDNDCKQKTQYGYKGSRL